MLDGKEMAPPAAGEAGLQAPTSTKPVKDLSGGQKRRLALIMLILLDEPDVLILDRAGNDLDHRHAGRGGGPVWTPGRARCFWSRTTATSWSASPTTSSLPW